MNVLVVQLGGFRVGLNTDVVRRIVAAVAIAPLPGAPSVVEGVLNVHGTLLPVLDLRARLGLPAAEIDPDQHIIIAEAGSRRVSLRVDRALDVISVPADVFETAERVAPGVAHVSGLARLPDGVLVIHDLERFLSAAEGREVDDALAAIGGTWSKVSEDRE